MPAGLLTGEDAKDVASYVAAVAGRDDVTAAPAAARRRQLAARTATRTRPTGRRRYPS